MKKKDKLIKSESDKYKRKSVCNTLLDNGLSLSLLGVFGAFVASTVIGGVVSSLSSIPVLLSTLYCIIFEKIDLFYKLELDEDKLKHIQDLSSYNDLVDYKKEYDKFEKTYSKDRNKSYDDSSKSAFIGSLVGVLSVVVGANIDGVLSFALWFVSTSLSILYFIDSLSDLVNYTEYEKMRYLLEFYSEIQKCDDNDIDKKNHFVISNEKDNDNDKDKIKTEDIICYDFDIDKYNFNNILASYYVGLLENCSKSESEIKKLVKYK